MSRSNSSMSLGWGCGISAVPLVLLLACAGTKPSETEEEPVVAGTEGLTTATTAAFQDGTNGYAGTRDTYLNQSAATTNYGTRTTLTVDGDDPTWTGRDLAALLYFDISSIPSNAAVTSVALTLYVTDTSSTGYPIYAMNRAWDEAQATWTSALMGTSWQTAGATGSQDRDSVALGTVVTSSTGSKTFNLNANGIAELQSWVAVPSSNYGFAIASASITNKLAFYSSEYGTVSRRPKLVVSYTVTTPDCVAPGCCTTDTACNDGNSCTTDACIAGVCGYATVAACCNSDTDCADDGNPCTSNSCIANICSYGAIAGCCLTDAECADADVCTTDACVANVCGHADVSGCCNDAVDCSDGNACTADSCTDHACGNAPVAGCCNSDSDCSDGIACTADACSNNVCTVSPIAGCCLADTDCADAAVCTADACVANQCTHSVLAGCCAADSECNDLDPCTTDSCLDAACAHTQILGGACGCGSDADCNDTKDCTIDTCGAGACSNAEAYPGACGCQSNAACADDNPCTIDTCVNALCTNTVANCSDGNPSTTDQCVAGSCNHSVPVAITKTFRNGENAYTGASDTKIAQYYPTTNYDTATVLVVDGDEPSGGSNDVASLFKWDNLGLPSAATITSASIAIYIGGGTNSASASAYSIYALNRPWTAAAATWELAEATGAWATPGAADALDREASAIGSTPISVSGSATIALNATGIARVQSWLSDPSTNFGIIIASSTNTDGLSLYSSEYSTVSYRPMLSVTYTGQQTIIDPVPVASAGNAPRYGFFVYSDSHVDAATNPVFSTALAQMNELKNADGAPPIIFAMSLGDHTENGLDASWDWHTALTGPYWDAAATGFGGALPRYIAAPGNHDVSDATNWYTYWSEHLPGQASLGGNSSSTGVYYSFTYENATFVALDTNKATNTSTSYLTDPQIQLLRSSLSNSTSPFKFMFYHMPAFYCGNGGTGPNASSVAFVDLAAQNNVDVIFNGHSHVYSRSCRMTKSHVCTGTTSGTVEVEVGTVGATDARLRALKTTAQSVTGYDASGVSAATSYACTSAGGYATTLGSKRTFCYVNVRGCWANVNCYQVGTSIPFDSWTLNHCQ